MSSVVKSSARGGQWTKGTIFRYVKLDEDGSGNHFETSQSRTDTPTLSLDSYMYPTKLRAGIMYRVHYRLNPTNAETYTLRLWRNNIAADYESSATIIYESAAARADDTLYNEEVVLPFRLADAGHIYYSIEWTGAAGNTLGYICAIGEVVHG